MTLSKHGFYFIAECDHCSETLETDADDWHGGIAAMKAAGWRIRPVGGEWDHKCGCCQADSGPSADDFEDVS